MTFNTAALYGCPQAIPSPYQADYEPPPQRRSRASTMTQDANTQWHRDAQRMPGLHATSNFQPPIPDRESFPMWDDVEVQNDWAIAAREQESACQLQVEHPFNYDQHARKNKKHKRVSVDTERGRRASIDKKCTRHESVDREQRGRVSIDRKRARHESVDRLLTAGDSAVNPLIVNESIMHLSTVSDSVLNLLIANESVMLLSTGDTIASATCRLDITAKMDLFLGPFLAHQFVLSPSGLLPQIPNPVLAHLNLDM